jgi:endo-1,4-beta-xylanase
MNHHPRPSFLFEPISEPCAKASAGGKHPNPGIPATIGGGLLALLLAVITLPAAGQMAATSNGKFVGNILRTTTTADPVFDTYWNQATPENSGKWESVEATRDVMNWAELDFMYAYTRARGIPFKQHTFVWGQQVPAWITTLTQAEQREEVEEWIAAFAARYPDTEFIDVVNEPLPDHAPAVYRDALGGAGTTGWDWVIWSFEKTRQYFPNAKLLLNDYSILSSDSATTQYLTLINLLKDRGLIDGIGEQAHFYENTSITTLQNNLNRLAATGLPIYISELDINLADDTAQSNRYQALFPIFWTNPAVRGITFWGYKQGQIWREDGYLLRTDGSERPAMSWLENYVAANPQSFSASVTAPANGQGLSNVSPVSASATVTYGTSPFTVTFQKKLDSETEFTTVSSDNTAPYTADLGNLPVEIYQIRVIVTDSDSATVTSTANTFNVFPSAGGTWLGTSGNWDDPGIWSGGTIANGIGSTASFTGVDIAADQTITLNGNRTIGNIVFADASTSSHNLTISGANTLTLDVDSAAPSINVTQADRTLTVSGVVAGNEGLQKAGLGTLALSADNTYSGTTTVSAGTLRLEGNAFSTTARDYSISSGAVLDRAAGQVPTGTTTISGDGTFRISGEGLGAGSDGRDLNLSMGVGGLIDIQSSIYNGGWQAINWSDNQATLNVAGSLNIVDGQAITAAALTGAGTIDSANAAGADPNGPANFTLGVGNGSGSFSGNITAAGTRVISLVKNGSGTQTFSGSTTFRGTTTVSGGTLQFAKASSLYAGVTTDWDKTKITVNNGCTIAFNVGGTNEFTTANVSVLLTGLGGALDNNGLREGTTIAFDTTNASGGTFTVADAIADTTGTGGGAVGLRKLGANTLVLSNNHTYTGPTIVDGGTLTVTGSLATTAVSVNGGTLAGNGNFGGNVTIGAGATHSLAVASTATGQDTSAITGTLAMAESTLTLTAASTPVDGVYVLAIATVGITGFPLFINYNGIDGTVSVDAASTPKRLLLTVTADYLSWASANGVTGGDNGDSDNDGVSNLVEYALVDGGGRGVLSGNTITFTKRGAPYGSDLTYIIETSETLSGSWMEEVTQGPAELGSPISYNLAPTPGTPKKFARLKVVKMH